MKTADLIPLLLIELNESDKYGFELTKNIETKSNGKIVIKQPTLYTLLKKLEKSKFISSYWQDSDIGGKRHYYKITDNGKLQLSTLPSYNELLNYILSENESEDFSEEITSNNNNSENLTSTPTPVETILPSEEVFADNSIDTLTQTSINQNNIELLKDDNKTQEEQFATNSNVTKFVEVAPIVTPEIKQNNENSKNELLNLDIQPSIKNYDVEYVDYVNLKTSKEYNKAKKFSKSTILKSVFISLYILIVLTSSILMAKKFGTSKLFYTTLIVGAFIAVFYPIITALYIDTIKNKSKQAEYKFNLKISLFVKSAIFCFVLLGVLVVNINIGNASFSKILNIQNFSNFYFPMLISIALYLDSVLGYLISNQLTK